jgi:hypothetical protein
MTTAPGGPFDRRAAVIYAVCLAVAVTVFLLVMRRSPVTVKAVRTAFGAEYPYRRGI